MQSANMQSGESRQALPHCVTPPHCATPPHAVPSFQPGSLRDQPWACSPSPGEAQSPKSQISGQGWHSLVALLASATPDPAPWSLAGTQQPPRGPSFGCWALSLTYGPTQHPHLHTASPRGPAIILDQSDVQGLLTWSPW